MDFCLMVINHMLPMKSIRMRVSRLNIKSVNQLPVMIVMMAGACISWRSSKQACVAVSTAESELIALSEGIKEGEWVNHLLTEMGFKPSGPVVIWCDNTAAIDIMHNPGNHKTSKHVETRYLMGRDLVETKRIKVIYCKTTKMIADSLTKALPVKQYEFLRYAMGVRKLA